MSEQTITTPTGLPADVRCSIQRGEDTIAIYLCHGGEQFPWAECNGRVLIGPPPEEATMTHDGVDMSSLNWEVSDYWVIEAIDESGSEITLTPEEYASVVRAG
jgi:hypothetical protein